MQLKYRDSNSIFSEVWYDREQNRFKISSSVDASEMFYYPILKLDNSYAVENFSYKLFYNDSSCENSIYQVYAQDRRIGWIFPVQALLSSDHDYSDDEYFLKYAFIATYLLLKDINQIDKIDSPQEFMLDDYIDEIKCILVIDHENIAKIADFNISDYTVSFFKFGYEYNGKGNFNPSDVKGSKRLKICSLAKELRGNPCINDLFVNQFLLASNSIIRFHICYQIIELLISKVFEHKFRSIVEKLSDNPEELFDLREDLSKITAEKERIKCLFEDYTKCDTRDKEEIGKACKQFLDLNGKKITDNFYYDLYSVRCLLVHKLYSINQQSHQLLDNINDVLLNIVMDMLFSFNLPNNN